ncbi:hypothetical protein DRJ22_04675 [Candidatus Woesearchaeota archaeon]|nr:MAG: hypothetical protein DRJ22_04675 [Candidatus Woesearchaeota archaeon]
MKLIIGLTGYSCTGKDTFYESIYEAYPIPRITTGDLVRKEVQRRGLEITPANISEIGDLIRMETRNNFMKIAEKEISALSRKYEALIVDSLREEQDYETLRQFSSNIETVAVVSASRIRYKRMAKRKRKGDPLSWEEFLALEQKERLLGVENLIKSAGFIVSNEEDIYEFRRKSIEIMKKLLSKYQLSI